MVIKIFFVMLASKMGGWNNSEILCGDEQGIIIAAKILKGMHH
jgi:hypothetical protein